MLCWIAASRLLETSQDEVRTSGTGGQGWTIPDAPYPRQHGDRQTSAQDAQFHSFHDCALPQRIMSFLLAGTAAL
jgi:hypothetical protein